MANGLRVEGSITCTPPEIVADERRKKRFTADLNATAAARGIRVVQEEACGLELSEVRMWTKYHPKIAVVSLHKRNVVMQFNGLSSVARSRFWKGLIEFFQVHRRSEPRRTFVWDALESTNVFLGRFLFKHAAHCRKSPPSHS